MIEGKEFCFGNGFMLRSKKFYWNPDTAINPHVMIWGTSGSGKTRLVKEMIKYLQYRKKHIHVVDIAGDMQVEGENLITFTSIDSPFGINIFEFDNTIRGGGPKSQINEIIEIFKKSFIPNMGAMQENVLRRMLTDVYILKGIIPNDSSSWENIDEDVLKKRLPSIELLKNLIDEIIESIENGFSLQFNKIIQKNGKILNSWKKELDKINSDIRDLKQNEGLMNENKLVKLETLATKKNELQNNIKKEKQKLLEYFSNYIDYRFLEIKEKIADFNENSSNIDYGFYANKEVLKVLKNLQIYINALHDSGAFSSKLPPVKPGLNRYDISALDRNVQIMFTEILLSRLVNKTRKRGEYKNLSETYKRKRGRRCDSFIIIDEAKNIMPRGKEKESSKFGINKGASESRKYGLGIIAISQSPADFTHTFVRNAATKIGLRVEAIDKPIVKNFCGIKEDSLFEHSQKFGIALINTQTGYESVILPWAKV